MPEVYTYNTIEVATTADFKDRGSKFVAFAYPLKRIEEVKSILQTLKKGHPKAVHFCYAYRMGVDGTQYRANDDGEPSGSAGRPILGQIDSASFTNILVVVVRYFGGTLLGVPGLVNAYKSATALALQQAIRVEKNIEKQIQLSFNYPDMGAVLYILKQSGAQVLHQDLQLFCEMTVGIPLAHYSPTADKLSEILGLVIKEG